MSPLALSLHTAASCPPADIDLPVADDVQLDHVLAESFLNSVPDLLYFKDRDSRFIAVSASKACRHNLNREELVGFSDADFFSPAHADAARADELAIMATGEPLVGKIERITWPDGRETWSRTTKLPLRDDDGAIIGTFGVSQDVTDARATELALEKAKRDLVDASRAAGMAEVATGVLHNVGNVLTSVNVSAGVLNSALHQSKAESLVRLSNLLQDHAGDLAAFLTTDPKGRRVPELLAALASHAVTQRDRLLAEIEALQKNVDHIKEIVAMQLAYATMVGVVEPLDAAALLDDAVRMNRGALVRHDVQVMREFTAVPPVVAEKGKVLQILVNLIRNAKYACDEGGNPEKRITLRIEPGSSGFVRLVVLDNGVGIPAENLTKIFQHGFTTRAQGHGFGLHSSANAAREMKGALTARSAGPGRGAEFSLELPVAPPGSIPANV